MSNQVAEYEIFIEGKSNDSAWNNHTFKNGGGQYIVHSGQKYMLTNFAKENGDTDIRIVVTRGGLFKMLWSPDSTPEAGTIMLGGNS